MLVDDVAGNVGLVPTATSGARWRTPMQKCRSLPPHTGPTSSTTTCDATEEV
jgi:hypothetical protein